jgi:uncharacterized damage-inducible protein DinB
MIFLLQYEMVQSSRNVLLEYCSIISEEHFVTVNPAFGRGSIRNLLVHIGNTYEFWLAKHALKKSVAIRCYEEVSNTQEAAAYFLEVDLLVKQFLARYSENFLEEMVLSLGNRLVRGSALQLFTHVVTHEFHHKGQILSLSRHFGYVPVDTDVVR